MAFRNDGTTEQTADRRRAIRDALESMPVGHCGIKFDVVVWRLAAGFIVGEVAVRRDGFIHSLDGCADWMIWHLGKAEANDRLIAELIAAKQNETPIYVLPKP